MAETQTIFSSKIKYKGIFDFQDFYKFCYLWLTEETGLKLTESKYKEKVIGDAKNLEIKWEGYREITDYFRFNFEATFEITTMTKIEVNKDGRKVTMNNGTVELKIKGVLTRDYKGKFEISATKKFMRSVYEKWIIPSRIEEFEGKIAEDCDEFLSQAKAFLDMEGKR